MRNVKYCSDYLEHHGILGQKWGKRNGPPYPLDADDHSAREKKAGYTKSIKNKPNSSSTKQEDVQWEKQKDNAKQELKNKRIKNALAIAGGLAVGYALIHYGKKYGLPAKMWSGTKDPDIMRQVLDGAVDNPNKELFNTDLWGDNGIMSQPEQACVYFYTGNSYKSINAALRKDMFMSTPTLLTSKVPGTMGQYTYSDFIKNVENAINKSPLDKQVTSYRMMNFEGLSKMFGNIDMSDANSAKNSLIGSQFKDKGFLSTSPGKPKTQFGDAKITMVLPKGTKALYIGKESQYPFEQELLVQRNSIFEVIDVISNSSGGVAEVVVKCVGQ